MRLNECSRQGRPRGHGGERAIEALESRTLLNATVSTAFTPVVVSPGAAPTNIDLSAHFSDPNVSGTVVHVVTSQGTFDLGLYDKKTPQTVANFLNYVNSGAYNNTVIQRAVPGFILQGGGYTANQNHIATTGTVPNEAGVSNTASTIAMALSNNGQGQTDPNSATSDWFINLANNTNLDASKFTAFGNVLYNGMTVVNNIVNLPKGQVGPNFVPPAGETSPELPLQNYNTGSPIQTSNYVTITSASTIPALTYTVSSDNPSLVSAITSGNNLGLSYGPGTGIAHVTITAKDLAGNLAASTLTVGVGVQQVTIGKGAAKLVRFNDPDGTASQISLSGAGAANILFSGSGVTVPAGTTGILNITGTPTAVAVSLTGTNATSTLAITGHGGNGLVNLAGISGDGTVRALRGPNTDVAGALTFAGSVGQVMLDAVPSGSVTAAGLSRVAIKGAFAANLTTSALGTFTAGSITGGTWNVNGSASVVTAKSASGWTGAFGALGRLAVAGALDHSSVLVGSKITSLTATSMNGTNVLVGVAGSTLPAAATDFSNTAGSITTLRVARTFQNSNVAAASLGNVNAGTIQLNNRGVPFGFAAHTIKSFTAVAGTKRLHLANVTSELQVTGALTAHTINPQDLVIRIV